MADTFHEGMKMRRAVLGDEHIDSAEKSKTAFDEDFPGVHHALRVG